jgi:tetratricopeptide (TPR) repeat protein
MENDRSRNGWQQVTQASAGHRFTRFPADRRPPIFHFSFFFFHLLPLLLFLAACNGSSRDDATLRFFLRGNLKLQEREFRQAIQLYNEAIQSDQDFCRRLQQPGHCQVRDRRLQRRRCRLQRGHPAGSTYTDAYYNRANAHEKLGQYPQSLTDLNRVAEIYKDTAKVFLSRALVKVQTNDYRGAVADFDRALSLDPDNAEAYVNRGFLKFNLRQYDAANVDFQKAISLDPRQDFAYNNLGLIRARNGEYDKALELLNQALQLKPEQPYYLNNRGYVKLMRGQLEEGMADVQRSLAKDSTNGWAYRNAGLYELKKGQPDLAAANFRKAMQKTSGVELVHHFLGLAYAAQGNREAACREWSISAELGEAESKPLLAEKCHVKEPEKGAGGGVPCKAKNRGGNANSLRQKEKGKKGN